MGMTGSDAQTIASMKTGVAVWVGDGTAVGVGAGWVWVGSCVRVAMDVGVTNVACSDSKVGWQDKRIKTKLSRVTFVNG